MDYNLDTIFNMNHVANHCLSINNYSSKALLYQRFRAFFAVQNCVTFIFLTVQCRTLESDIFKYILPQL